MKASSEKCQTDCMEKLREVRTPHQKIARPDEAEAEGRLSARRVPFEKFRMASNFDSALTALCLLPPFFASLSPSLPRRPEASHFIMSKFRSDGMLP